MQLKSVPAQIKAVGTDGGLADGQFEAIVSVFGNEDSYGDVVLPGAFAADLERWKSSGDPIPVIWSHDWADPFAHLGVVLDAEERPEGLWVRGEIKDIETNPKAAQVYALLKGRRVKQFSFAYDVLDGGFGSRDGRDIYELRELKVHEVGPCLLGVNQETELLAVKARQIAAKADLGMSDRAREVLREAHDAMGAVLKSATPADPTTSEPTGPETETDEPSQVEQPATPDEEPDGAKSSEPVASAPRRALAVARINNLL